MITTIIIEDDVEAISLLEIYLKAFQEVEIIGKTIHPKLGIKLLIKKMPDLVFLDIDMPEINGIEVAEVIKKNKLNTEIVFTTAHSKYAFKSLKFKPLDYLVKPFGPEELISVINRYKTRVKGKEMERRMSLFIRSNRPAPKLKLPTRTGIILVHPDEIMMLKAEEHLCSVYINNRSVEMVTLSQQKILELIDSPSFVRANRSSFINLQFLRRIDKKNKHCTLIHQDFRIELPINRSTLVLFEKLNCFPIA